MSWEFRLNVERKASIMHKMAGTLQPKFLSESWLPIKKKSLRPRCSLWQFC